MTKHSLLCTSAFIVGAFILTARPAWTDVPTDLSARLKQAPASHPRLFFTAPATAALKAKIDGDPLLAAVQKQLIAVSDAVLDDPPVTRTMTGKRLLGVSRTCLQRVSYLAFAHRITGEVRYLERAEKEMLAAAAFEDWNPSHFLDVAEMTTALAVGYDWLYDGLRPETRTILRDAIVKKGLETSFPGGSWVTGTNNWNQVCHGGLTVGALAVLEDFPELAEKIISRALTNVPRAMHEYEPDGVYPEGPGYWQYGTTYNVLMISALESVLGTDCGLGSAAGFLKSPEFYLHATGPSGLFFNFSDCGERGGVSPAMQWFARRLQNPSLLWREQREMALLAVEKSDIKAGGDRVLPFLLVWAQPSDAVTAQQALCFKGDGPTPVAVLRSDWTDNATYVGFKGGSPGANHAHMDTGSFVLDMQGVRWAVDLGAQSYNSLESRGIGLWNKRQESERWSVFRLNNHSHNTLTVDGQLQRVGGKGVFTRFSGESPHPFAVLDMTTVYEGQLAHAERGIRLLGESVLVQDEVKALDRAIPVRWAMATRAELTLTDSHTATLRQNGKRLRLRVLSPADAKLAVQDIGKPPHDYDVENPDTRMVVIDAPVEAGTTGTWAVLLQPEETPDAGFAPTALKDW